MMVNMEHQTSISPYSLVVETSAESQLWNWSFYIKKPSNDHLRAEKEGLLTEEENMATSFKFSSCTTFQSCSDADAQLLAPDIGKEIANGLPSKTEVSWSLHRSHNPSVNNKIASGMIKAS